MDAGELDRRVTLLKRSLRTQAPGNEQREQFDARATLYAKVEPLTGREFFAASELYKEETLKITIRWRDDVDAADRLLYRDVPYKIVHLAEIGRREFLEILAVQAPR